MEPLATGDSLDLSAPHVIAVVLIAVAIGLAGVGLRRFLMAYADELAELLAPVRADRPAALAEPPARHAPDPVVLRALPLAERAGDDALLLVRGAAIRGRSAGAQR